MKVIRVSNFDDETVSHLLIKDNLTASEARHLCNELRKQCNEHSYYWYCVIEDDYQLYKYNPE